jgi:hypothetical protein
MDPGTAEACDELNSVAKGLRCRHVGLQVISLNEGPVSKSGSRKKGSTGLFILFSTRNVFTKTSLREDARTGTSPPRSRSQLL